MSALINVIKAKLQQCNDAKLKGLYEIASCRLGDWIFYFMTFKALLKKPRFRIALATSIVIFTLGTTISGTFAWFAATMSNSMASQTFSVKATGSAGISQLSLYKFDYGSTFYGTFETIDYLTPETGSVNLYDYNKEDNYFGVQEDGVWTERIETMNIYDPTDTVIRKIDLKEVNCNIIYRIEFEPVDIVDAYLVATGSVLNLIPGANEILLSDCIDIDVYFNEDLLATNTSYIQEDNPATTTINEYDDQLYIPSYKKLAWNKYHQWNGSDWVITSSEPATGQDKGSINYADYLPPHAESGNTANPSSGDYYKVLYAVAAPLNKYYKWNGSSWVVSDERPSGEGITSKGSIRFLDDLPSTASTGDFYHVEYKLQGLTEKEEVYYKLSYLSSEANSHMHFYGNTPAQKQDSIVMIRNKYVDFDQADPFVVYVNVNYAPSTVNKYVDSIALGNIVALHDYSFLFEFLTSPREFD